MHHCTISISPNEILDTEGKGSTQMAFAPIHDSSLLHIQILRKKICEKVTIIFYL